MKIKKLGLLLYFVFPLTFGILVSCDDGGTDDEEEEEVEELVGQPGNPRFNLQFINEENVDLDLYVETPSGSVIYYGNYTSDNGQLDVDCLCEGCPQGGNENIYWEDGTAPTGTYKYWVEYFGDCYGEASSDYVMRVVKNTEVVAKHEGTLSTYGSSPVWTFEQQ